MSRECVVLNVSDFDNWGETWGAFCHIPANQRSTVIHLDRDIAEQEAVRLLRAGKGQRFAVLAVVGVVELKEVATHVTLGGKVISTVEKPVWVAL